jgi:outer membrane immunogenic protein
MRRLARVGVGVLAGLLALAAPALAADVPPSRTMPPPRAPALVPFFTWSGFYLGFNIGYGWGTSSASNALGVVLTDFSLRGLTAGGTLGYNWQTGAVVFGFEGDFDYSNIRGSPGSGLCAGGTCEVKNQFMSTFRGRIGYAFDRFMPYITGGGALGKVDVTVLNVTESKWKFGWTVGAGLEWAFLNNWTAKLEYLYVDLGKVTCSAATCFLDTDVKVSSQLVRGGVNFKF